MPLDFVGTLAYLRYMFKAIRELSEAVQALRSDLASQAPAPVPDVRVDSLDARLSELESSVSVTVAEAKALVMEAKEQLRQARAADERARYKLRKAEELEEELEEGGRDSADWLHDVPVGDAGGGPENGVLPMPAPVAGARRPNRRELARAYRASLMGN
jgi:hypothetical protein